MYASPFASQVLQHERCRILAVPWGNTSPDSNPADSRRDPFLDDFVAALERSANSPLLVTVICRDPLLAVGSAIRSTWRPLNRKFVRP